MLLTSMARQFKSLFLGALLSGAPLISSCSLIFHEADGPSALLDAGIPGLPGDAGTVVPWEAIVQWTSISEPFHAAGVLEEGPTIKLIGELHGEITVNNVTTTPNGSADLGFMNLDPSDGTPLLVETFGDVGTPTILSYRAHEGTHSVVGIFKDRETFCPTAVFEGCTVTPPGVATSAFASRYAQLPSVSQNPAALVTLSYTSNTTTQVPETLVQSALSFVDRQVIAGSFKKDVTLTGGNEVFDIENTEESSKNLFILNLGVGGVVVEAVVPDQPGDQIAWAVEPSGQGNLFVAGTYEGSLDLEIDEGESLLPPSGGNSLFVLHANRGLSNALWTKPFGTGVSGLPVFARATSDDGLLLAGSFVDSLFLPNGNILQDSGGGESAFAMKISEQGEIVWARAFGTDSAKTRVRGLVIGSDEEIFIAGEFEGAMELGTSTLESSGNVDAFLIRLDTLGRTRGGIALGSPAQQNDNAARLFILEDNSVLVEVLDLTRIQDGADERFVGRTLYRVR